MCNALAPFLEFSSFWGGRFGPIGQYTAMDGDSELPAAAVDAPVPAADAGPGEHVVVDPDGFKVCDKCDDDLPATCFDCRFDKRGGMWRYAATCKIDCCAIEAIQRKYRVTYPEKKIYMREYTKLKKDRDRFKAEIRQVRADNPDIGKNRNNQAVKVSNNIIQHLSSKGNRTASRKGCRPFTWPAWEEYAATAQGGGYSGTQALSKWHEMKQIGYDEDNLGVVKGESGHKRFWVPAEELRYAEDFDERQDQLLRQAKSQKTLTALQKRDFLAGDLKAQSDCDDEANDETPKETPKKRRTSAASTAASAASPEKGPQQAIGMMQSPENGNKTFDADIHLPPAWEALATTIQELKETQRGVEQGLEAIRVEHLCKSDGADDADKMSSFHAYAQTLAKRTKVAGALVSKKSLAEAKESLLNTEGLPVNHWDSAVSIEELSDILEEMTHCTSHGQLKGLKTKSSTMQKRTCQMLKDCEAAGSSLIAAITREAKRQNKAKAPATTASPKAKAKASESAVPAEEDLPALFTKSAPGASTLRKIEVAGDVRGSDLIEQVASTDGKPFVVAFGKVGKTWRQDAAFQTQYTSFKNDFMAEAHKCKTGRQQRCMETGAASVCVEEAMQAMMPSWAACVLPARVHQHCPPEHIASALRYACGYHFWGMTAKKYYIGVDWNGFGSIRFQLVGLRSIWLFPIAAIKELMSAASLREADGAAGVEPVEEEQPPPLNTSAAAMRDFLTQVNGERLTELINKDGVLQTNLKENEALVVPHAYMIAERTFAAAALGVKRVLLPSKAAHNEAILEMQVGDAPTSVQLLMDISVQLQKPKKEAQPQHNEEKREGEDLASSPLPLEPPAEPAQEEAPNFAALLRREAAEALGAEAIQAAAAADPLRDF